MRFWGERAQTVVERGPSVNDQSEAMMTTMTTLRRTRRS